MSLFDMVADDQKAEFDVPLPDVGEYEKETKFAFEKEVLGVYLSGHPMEEYEEKWRKNITRTTLDFQLDEDTGRTKVHDGARETIGGMITAKTIKYTKQNKVMAFVTLEDLAGSVEVVVFPRDYEKNQQYLDEEGKVFIRGRVSEEDEAASKLICEKVIPFEQTKRELWLQYPDKDTYLRQEGELLGLLADSDGQDSVVIYCKKEKAIKRLPANRCVNADKLLLNKMTNYLGESCVKVIEKAIENVR
jgi:DNA polymerase-3 subunit alpha